MWVPFKECRELLPKSCPYRAKQRKQEIIYKVASNMLLYYDVVKGPVGASPINQKGQWLVKVGETYPTGNFLQPKGFSPHRGIAQPLRDMACRQGCQGRFVVT